MFQYKNFAIRVARQAGAIIRKNFKLGINKEWKSDYTPLTIADTAINCLLIKEVKKYFPRHDVLGEEESSLVNNSDWLWVCDPLDGTIPFSHGLPICTFSLALVNKGQVMLGVVYDPFGNRLFFAEKGRGTFLNGKKIKVSSAKDLIRLVGNCEFYSTRLDISPLFMHLQHQEHAHMLKLCSCIYASVLVATGELGFSIFPGATAHDAAAVKIIVEEAGGIVTDIFGRDQRYDRPVNGFIAANPILHKKLVSLAKKLVVIKKI